MIHNPVETTGNIVVHHPVFDYHAPLPDLHIRETRSWEPAARHYRDLTEEEKAQA